MGLVRAPVAEKTAAKLSRQLGVHAVGGTSGLYLAVKAAGRASWIFRYTLDGRRRDMGIGSLADLPLAEAREKAGEQRKLVSQGIDPLDAKRELRDARKAANAKRVTFRQCVDAYLDAHGDGWRRFRCRQAEEPTHGIVDLAAQSLHPNGGDPGQYRAGGVRGPNLCRVHVVRRPPT